MKALSPALEAYALKAHHYGRISGVSVAVHAIADGFHLLHTGVGCKYKAAAQISTHDWARQPHRREGWTEVGDSALIRGAAARIAPYVRSWYDRQQPGLMIVSSASFLEMTGEDIAGAVRQADETVPCPVRYVPGSPGRRPSRSRVAWPWWGICSIATNPITPPTCISFAACCASSASTSRRCSSVVNPCRA